MTKSKKSLRQSFLGAESDAKFSSATIAIVGLCGGGSHVAQQCAHIGIGNYVLIDFDRIDETNLNRLVGATSDDVKDSRLKVEIARDLVLRVQPTAKIQAIPSKWQAAHEKLRTCTAVFGCVDSYTERERLEAYCRRFHIAYFDIGMDIFKLGNEFSITGQAIASIPGELCMRCMGYMTNDLLTREAQDYGAAGGKPQVVWPNGVLASTVVKMFVSMMSPWRPSAPFFQYMEYNGDTGVLVPSPKLEYLRGKTCDHFHGDLGDPFWTS